MTETSFISQTDFRKRIFEYFASPKMEALAEELVLASFKQTQTTPSGKSGVQVMAALKDAIVAANGSTDVGSQFREGETTSPFPLTAERKGTPLFDEVIHHEKRRAAERLESEHPGILTHMQAALGRGA